MASYSFSNKSKIVPLVKTPHRVINTMIPTPGTDKILERIECVESRSMHGQLPIVWDSAKDFSVFDSAGNKWIDFTSTIFVANVGHSNDNVCEAIRCTLDKSILSCYAYGSEIRAKYLEKLISFSGDSFQKAFLLSAGTEATEAAFKLMRMYGKKKKKHHRGVICIEGNWHGRTMGAQMMCNNKEQRDWIGYQDKHIHHIPFPYPWVLNDKSPEEFLDNGLNKLIDDGVDIENDICGFMLETFQGWGALFYPPEFVKSIENLCRKYGILLAFDEMQSGFGRTGRAFGFQHYDVSPDLICCGKGMGGGISLSGVIGRAEIMDLPEVGNMSSTHSANPLVCAAGLAVIEEIENRNLIAESARKGEILFSILNDLKLRFSDRISDVFGNGLIAAVLFHDPKTRKPDNIFTSRVAELCMQKGLLVVHTGRESIKIGPPLTITDIALIEGLSVLSDAIDEVSNNN